MPPSRADLLVFDCDGVLVDSEAIACRVVAELFRAAGFPLGFEDIRREFVGIATQAMCRDVEARFGRALPADMPERILAAELDAFECELAPIAGVGEALAVLEGPRCVASSSDPPRIRRALELSGLLAAFEPHLFSATMVARGKPAPDLFLHAAEAMRVPPARCLVIEDSVPGVLAARAAGMAVLGFYGGGHCAPGHEEKLRAAGAAAVFARMEELPALVARAGRV